MNWLKLKGTQKILGMWCDIMKEIIKFKRFNKAYNNNSLPQIEFIDGYTAIFSAAKQNDHLHESCLVQGMAKILLFNFVLLTNF